MEMSINVIVRLYLDSVRGFGQRKPQTNAYPGFLSELVWMYTSNPQLHRQLSVNSDDSRIITAQSGLVFRELIHNKQNSGNKPT